MATLNEEVRRLFEPNAPPVAHRINALKQLYKEGIRTWVFLAPIMPDLTYQSLFELLNEIKRSVDYVLVDTLNIKCGNWRGITKALTEKYPALLDHWKLIFSTKENKKQYYQNLYHRIVEFSKENNLDIQFC